MEIAPGVYSIGQNKAGQIHAYLLDDGNGLTAIDTLFDTDARPMLGLIKSLGKSITDLKRIILTHGHRSHIGGAAELKRLSGATVYAHAREIRCQFIILARKVEPTPDYAPDNAKR